jgi:hypothetical protein
MAYPTIQYTGYKLLLASVSTHDYLYTRYSDARAAVIRHVTHYEPTTISAARNLALRARGLSRTSCFVGIIGFGVNMRKLAL